MVNQPNLLIGVLSQLNTVDQTNLVNAINEVYNMFGSVSDAGIRIYEGTEDPNTTPPSEFKIGDFYIQKDLFNNPLRLFQYNGLGWFPMLVISDIINDSLYSTETTWSSEKIFNEIETAISGAGTVTEVTGVLGEITVSTGATTPVVGIDPSFANSKQDVLTEENVGEFMDLNLTTKVTPGLADSLLARDVITNNAVEVTIGSVVDLANIYADSKIQNTITDGVTDKAPSENAVFDALALKENIQDYLQQHLFNFNFNTTSIAGFINTPLSAGTLTTQSDSLTPISLRYNRPNDIVECWAIRGNASSANSGYIVGYTSQNPMYVGSTMFMAINVLRITDTVQRYGLIANSSLSPLSSLMGNASICVEINNNQLTFKTSTTNISTAPAYTIPSPQWLYVMFEVESLTAIRCKIRLGLTGTLVYNEVISTNLPITQEGISWSQLRFCLSAVTTVASGDYLSLLGTLKTFAKKPNYLKYF